jgi:DNA-binding transcriptional ArsR family regulator
MLNTFKSSENAKIEDIFSSRGRTKIIKLLALKDELNISKIVELTGLNHLSVKTHLFFFKEIDFVQEKKFGRIKIYRFKTENLKAKALKNLIQFWEFDNGL